MQQSKDIGDNSPREQYLYLGCKGIWVSWWNSCQSSPLHLKLSSNGALLLQYRILRDFYLTTWQWAAVPCHLFRPESTHHFYSLDLTGLLHCTYDCGPKSWLGAYTLEDSVTNAGNLERASAFACNLPGLFMILYWKLANCSAQQAKWLERPWKW